MTINEIPNIGHCDVEPLGTSSVRITSHEGWYIHLNDGDEETVNIWKTVVILRTNSDFSIVEIRPEAELPEGAEICGGDNEPEHEIM